MKRMIVDTANVLFRVAAAHGKQMHAGTIEEMAGLALHSTLITLNSYYKKYKPDQLAFTFEGRNNWRKSYTKSDECISGKIYKANRVKDSSMDCFFELIQSFEDLARKHTALVCLSSPLLEGDDLFAGYVQRFAATDEVIGVSGDKDFVQLLKYPNFTLINPDKGKPRTLIDVCGVDDANFFIFEKILRGDKGDNVFPAYPRIFKKRIQKCYENEYERVKMLNEEWTYTDPDTQKVKVFKVGDLFKENALLLNLEAQPESIKRVINDALDEGLANHGTFSGFHFVKFCGKYGLKQIADNMTKYANMFSATEAKALRKAQLVDF